MSIITNDLSDVRREVERLRSELLRVRAALDEARDKLKKYVVQEAVLLNQLQASRDDAAERDALRARLQAVEAAAQQVINTARPEPDLPEWEDEFYVPAKSTRALVDALSVTELEQVKEYFGACVCGHTYMAHDEKGWCYYQDAGCKCQKFAAVPDAGGARKPKRVEFVFDERSQIPEQELEKYFEQCGEDGSFVYGLSSKELNALARVLSAQRAAPLPQARGEGEETK